MSNYYYGWPGVPRLLARSHKEPWAATFTDDSGFRTPTPIRDFVLKDRIIKETLEKGLRESIRNILMTMRPLTWIAVDYVRLGHSTIEMQNPAVILITAENDYTSTAEAERVVKKIKEECIR